jgi:predicted dehydrogenase
VVGVGALGQHHARVYASLEQAELVGVYDTDEGRASEVAARHGARSFSDVDALLESADAVSVAVPTESHHSVSMRALAAECDVLVEKPIAVTRLEGEELIAKAALGGRILQVGHIERFNPATDVLRSEVRSPRFIEVHRLGAFSPRSLDIDVVLDLMIHDLDIVLHLDGSEAVQVDAVGVPVLTPKVDIANARLRFESGLIANITASRVSADRVRKFRVFSPHKYISVDFAAREAQIHALEMGKSGRPELRSSRTAAPEQEPLRRQLEAFLAAVRDRSRPLVSGEDGLRALTLAHRIVEAMGELPMGAMPPSSK